MGVRLDMLTEKLKLERYQMSLLFHPRPPLFAAISSDDADLVQTLLEQNAANPNEFFDSNQRTYTPISWVSSSAMNIRLTNRQRIIEILVQFGGNPALHSPLLECDELAVADYLIQIGARVDQTVPPPYPFNGTALVKRAINYETGYVELLLRNGASPNSRTGSGDTIPLHIAKNLSTATETHSNEIFDLLGSSGGDLNVYDRHGWMSLMYVVSAHEDAADGSPTRDFWNTASILIRRGADISARDRESNTILHIALGNPAVRIPRSPLIRGLLANGADLLITSFNLRGHSPLHIVAHTSFSVYDYWGDTVGLAALLIARGADVNMRDNEGETPLLREVKYICPPPGTVSPYPPPRPGSPRRQIALDLLNMLLRNGGDKKIRDISGRDATGVARAARQYGTDVLPILARYG